jgi:hypothetical protein
MSLKPISTATFEAEDEGTAGAAAATVATSVGVTTAASTAVATKPAGQPSVASQFASTVDVVSARKNAMPVTFDMLVPLIANNGNICRRADKKALGDEIVFELMSWQDSFVVTPGDDKAPKETLRYSDDGVVCSDGTLVQEHLADLRSLGYHKAAVKQRLVVVGSVISCSKSKELDDELVQLDLSPQSRASFLNYALGCVNKIRLGKLTEDQVLKIKATAEVVTMGGNPFTKLAFSAA